MMTQRSANQDTERPLESENKHLYRIKCEQVPPYFKIKLFLCNNKQPISLDEAKQLIDPALIKKLFDFASVAGMDLTNPVILKQTEFAIYDDMDKGRYFKVTIAVDNRKLDLVLDKEGNIHNV